MQTEAKPGISFSCPQPESAADFSQHSCFLYKTFILQICGKQMGHFEVVKHWKRFPIEAGDAPNLSVGNALHTTL